MNQQTSTTATDSTSMIKYISNQRELFLTKAYSKKTAVALPGSKEKFQFSIKQRSTVS